jgi:cobalt-zinc-cadmium efflux system protein
VSREKRLWVVLLLNLLLIAGLVIVGLLAIWLTHRPPSSRRPNGSSNPTTVAAAVNGEWLLVLSVLVIVTAIRRPISGAPSVEGLPVLIASAVAAVVMLVGALILGGDVDDDGDDLNVKAVLLDTAADAAAAAGVAVSPPVVSIVAENLRRQDRAMA